MAEIDRLAALAADRERVYRVVAYSEPPAHLCMGRNREGYWVRRGTGAYAVETARALSAAGVRGVIEATSEYLAGTPNWTPEERQTKDEPETTDPRRMKPAEFARRFKDAATLWQRAAATASPNPEPQKYKTAEEFTAVFGVTKLPAGQAYGSRSSTTQKPMLAKETKRRQRAFRFRKKR